MRINKLLSNFGICSRKEANNIIKNGRILVNGKECTEGQWVELTDEILLDGEILKEKEKVYLLLNKPVGVTCTASLDVKDNIIDYVNYKDYIFPVGRLDKPSRGLILLTNDGDLANDILESENNHEKEYLVTVDKIITDEFIEGMENGVLILGVKTRKCKMEKVNDYDFKITLTQGLNKQIRRMCKNFHYNVLRLERIRILNLKIDNLEYGKYRELTKSELEELKKNL